MLVKKVTTHKMETFTPEQLKKKYNLNTTSTQKVFTPDQLKSKYGISEPEQAETRESRIEQELPVGTGDRVKPTFGGEIVRGLVKPFVKLGASVKAVGEAVQGKTPTGIKSEFLGDVRPIGEGFDVTKGLKENIKPLKDAVGTGAELASFIPIVRGAKVVTEIAKQPFKQALTQSAKTLGKEGAVQGGLSSFGTSLQNDENITKTIGNTLLGTGLGGVLGAGLGAGGTGISRALTKKPVDFVSKQIDDSIRKVFSGTTADTAKLDDMVFKSKKGLELLVNESPNIEVPDLKAPLGSRAVKPFDIEKATPNEFISAVESLTRKTVNNARTAVEEASQKGFNLDVNNAKKVITQSVNNGDIPVATANRLLKQLDATNGDAVKVFDWVQDVNKKYKNRFEKGTIDDMATSKIANDIAEVLRKELNTITDRTGYAESMANISELKRMLIAVAKKANKDINFGDITSEAGLDTGIALLTGNPAYMARTLASGIFKGIIGKVKNSAGLRGVRGAVKNIKTIPNTQKLPSLNLKQERLLLPAPRKGAVRTELGSAKTINQPSRKAIEQGTEIVPRNVYNTSLKNQGNTTTTMNKTNIANKTVIPKLVPQSKLRVKPTLDLGKKTESSIISSISEAKAYGQSFDEWVKGQGVADDVSEYGMSHRPSEGVRAFNLTEKVDGDQMIPKDMYTQWYSSRGTKADLESISVLKKIKDNPEATVTIYRASPKESFNNGDWVTFSKTYATEHAQGNNTKVFSKTVKAKDVRWAMDDINEFGYYPENLKTRSQLKAEWDKIKTIRLPKNKGSIPLKSLGLGVLGLGTILPSNKETYTAEKPTIQQIKKIPSQKISNALMQLESSGGKDKRSADPGEMKWLTGLTNVAIKELQRVGKIGKIDVNDKQQVLDASAKYFELMQERNPGKTPGEIYVDHYWTQWKNMPNGLALRDKKIKEFNNIVNS